MGVRGEGWGGGRTQTHTHHRNTPLGAAARGTQRAQDRKPAGTRMYAHDYTRHTPAPMRTIPPIPPRAQKNTRRQGPEPPTTTPDNVRVSLSTATSTVSKLPCAALVPLDENRSVTSLRLRHRRRRPWHRAAKPTSAAPAAAFRPGSRPAGRLRRGIGGSGGGAPPCRRPWRRVCWRSCTGPGRDDRSWTSISRRTRGPRLRRRPCACSRSRATPVRSISPCRWTCGCSRDRERREGRGGAE